MYNCLAMEISLFFALVFCCSCIAETVISHGIAKREAEQPSELKLENELRRVKRIIASENDVQTLARVKRMKRGDDLEHKLYRVKRLKRSFYEPYLARVKRSRRSTDLILPELSRVKRFKDLDADRLSRIKRLRRSLPEKDLARVKRTKRSVESVLQELSRVKRFHDKDTFELSRVKRLKRGVLESDNHLLRNMRAKRIPPDVHRRKRIKNNRKFSHSSLERLTNRKRNFNTMNKSQQKHFRELHGQKFNLDKNTDLAEVKQMLSGEPNDVKEKRHKLRSVGTFKQRVQKRLRERHNLHQKRMKHRKQKVKKDKHHIQSHRLNKKNIA